MKSILITTLVATTLASAQEAPVSNSLAADRKAILAMAGEFAVTFHFQETAAFKTDYVLGKAYDESAHELVIIAKDQPHRIELQHMLVHGGEAIKHWRQVWTYQDTQVCEYQSGQTWKIKTLPKDEVAGTWTQQVTQIDDSPRYEGIGRWSHTGGVSQWISGDTWRPLPRRESKRSGEYQVITGTNRHTLTADGWVHEQDNTKTVVVDCQAVGAIAREVGTNHYRKLAASEKVDFSAAHSLWQAEGPFWNTVLAEWETLQAKLPVLKLESPEKLRAMHSAVGKLKTEPKPEVEVAVRKTLAEFLMVKN